MALLAKRLLHCKRTEQAFPRNVIRFPAARIERARDCEGWYVIRGSHGWLFGGRRQALAELKELNALARGAPLPHRRAG
jgi:hypothetical protein